jgi:UDP-N-acetylmuramoyl-tripeptide--D-alanyl-D-alanine ligase
MMRGKILSRQTLTLANMFSWSGSGVRPDNNEASVVVKGINNDSRTIVRGEVFVALKTERNDGHLFVADALKRGACAAIVDKKKINGLGACNYKKLIPVGNTLVALQKIAARYRTEMGIPIVGITGSSGKTTTRSFISNVLKNKFDIGETSGNLNNHIGVPVSLLRFTGAEEAGVLEMGANHRREIHILSRIVKPDIGVITNIGYAHIGYFGSKADIAEAKLEIVDGMNNRNGILMLNGDDTLLINHAENIGIKKILFGFSPKCTVRAVKERLVDDKTVSFEVDGMVYRIGMPGRHFIYCALVSIYIGEYFGIERSAIAEALYAIRPVAMRGTIEKKAGATFVVDCYNANPSSMKTSIKLLTDVAGNRKPVAVVGDMLELGKYSRSLHRALGRQLVRAGVRDILAVGEFAGYIAEGAIEAGFKPLHIRTAQNSANAVDMAKEIIGKGDVVLLKGSRGIHLETIYQGL